MANRLAEDALAGREQASYRDYLNAMANTNIRSREQEAMDRYRQGELGIRGEDVSGLNQFRAGQIGIGRTDAATRAEDVFGMNQFRTGQLGIGQTDAATRAAAAKTQAAYQQNLVEAGRTAEQNRLALETDRNRLLKAQIDAATGLPALQAQAIKDFGSLAEAIKGAPGLFNAAPSDNLRLLQLQNQATNQSEFRKARTDRQQGILKQYFDDTTGFFTIGGAINPNDPSTVEVDKLITNKTAKDPYEAALILADEQLAPMFGVQSMYNRSQAAAPVSPVATQTPQSAGKVYTSSTVGFYPTSALRSDETVRNIRSFINNGNTNQAGISPSSPWERYTNSLSVKSASR